MNKIKTFDVLIVYTEALAVSASENILNLTPFPAGSRNESYNIVYGYFLQTCSKNDLKVAFTTSADIIGAGLCRSYWTYDKGEWAKSNESCYSELIFDKFSPVWKSIKTRRQLLFSSNKINSFNDPILFGLFFDKQKTYEELSDYAIPTVALGIKTLKGISDSCLELENLVLGHSGSMDFNQDIVMKDRFGAGGRHVYKFKKEQSEAMMAVIKKNTKISFVIQPFALFDKGFCYGERTASTDVRLIYLNGRIVQSYIRMAKQDDFRCNEHQGGSLNYVSQREIPRKLISKANLIAKKLNKNNSLYALDFIVSNTGNTYLLEGNTGPGLDWNLNLKRNEREAKKLIRLLVKELVIRAEAKPTINITLKKSSILATKWQPWSIWWSKRRESVTT